MVVLAPAGNEVGFRTRIVGVDPRVELPVSRGAGLIEVRMECEALQTDLHDRYDLEGRFHLDLPPRLAGVEVSRHTPVIADGVEEAPHVVDEEAAGARLVDEHHGAGRRAVQIREGCELLEPDDDHAVGCRDRLRKRIVRDLGDGRAGDQRGCDSSEDRGQESSPQRYSSYAALSQPSVPVPGSAYPRAGLDETNWSAERP